MSHLGLARRLATLALVAAALVAPASPAGAAEAPPSSMWVWSRDDPAELVQLAEEQGVDRLYVFVHEPVGDELARLRQLAELADPADIELWAMSGEPQWAMRHRDVLAWQRAALRTGLFVGTHLDVEPYAMRRWRTDKERVVARFLAMLERVQQADPRPLAVDVPYWYGDHEAEGGTVADAVLEIADSVTVMSYRDTATGPNSLMVVATDMLARAAAAGVPLELAVETNRIGCAHCTFYEEGADALHDVVTTVDGLLADHPTYTGFAVHDYDGYRALLERCPLPMIDL